MSNFIIDTIKSWTRSNKLTGLAREQEIQRKLIEETYELLRSRQGSGSVALPAGGGATSKRQSGGNTSIIAGVKSLTNEVKPSFARDMIPYIRKLSKVNAVMGQALFDAVQLSSTRHKIHIDGATPEEQRKIRSFIKKQSKHWMVGSPSLEGIINKMFTQVYISGASSAEWVPKRDLTGLAEVIFVNPEDIVYKLHKSGYPRYRPYQKVKNTLGQKASKGNLNPLNIRQFCYVGMGNDEDTPYGIPPYLTALKSVKREESMLLNIDNIIHLLGVLGYIDATIEKPDQEDGESDEKYTQRCNALLQQMKDRVLLGIKDGINVGFKDEHEFDFKQTTSSVAGVTDLFNSNQLQFASGLKFDAAFLGVSSSDTETSITVLFSKVVSTIRTAQRTVKENVEFGLELLLRLARFNYEAIRVEFEPPTITDDLKYQQGQEIKIRNNISMLLAGVIDQDTMADNLTGQAPASPAPLVPYEALANGVGSAKDKEDREKDKDKSDRKGRDKKKPRGSKKPVT